jgi:hypothetical protein
VVGKSTAAVSNTLGVSWTNDGRTLTDKHLYKVAAGDGEKWHPCFSRNSLWNKERGWTAVDGSSHTLEERLRGVATLASSVLPVPGGPTSSAPRGG